MTQISSPIGKFARAAWVRALEATAPIADHPARTLPLLVDEWAERFGDSPALLSDRDDLTYRELADRVHRWTRWALAEGLNRGEVVCLLMPNCPEYLAIWLGITRTGAIVSLLNTNLTGAALAHCITIAAPRHVIVGAALAPALLAVQPHLAPGTKGWVQGVDAAGLQRIDPIVDRLPAAPIEIARQPPPVLRDRALLIYTSGTTGLPKAAHVSHYRLMQWSHWFAGLIGTGPADRMYNCLPMYHSVGGVVATGAVLVNGGSVVLRERFSASRFWDDIARWDCTLFQYIGEFCRYLVGSPPHPREADHRLRLCCGNGLRADLWEPLRQRFRIPQILEFYAATEGSFSLYNCDNKPGAIGRVPPFLAHRFPIALVKFDVDSDQPTRDAAGLCLRCATNEVGEALGQVGDDGTGGRFEGYTDPAASAGKVLRDVFAEGDAWFRTGDLMRKDEQGYYYFVDRVGDTFRWKGENVSTLEVAEVIAGCPGIADAVVYGVEVPGTEGRAGMAAIVTAQDFCVDRLREHLAARLPDYARPLFLRLLSEIETTGTFKPKKQDLIRDAYDPSASTDRVYFYDRSRRAFAEMNTVRYEDIQTGLLAV